MRLALGVGYWGAGMSPEDQLTLVKEADRLGYHSVWVAEAYGSDAVTVLTWFAANTERIGLGTGILQMTARAPAMTAMTAATLDVISGGRVLLGLGLSGPQVVEGWYGLRYDKPITRTREYIEIVRKVISREDHLSYDGEVYQLPLPDSQGKPLKLIIHPVRDSVPIYLAAIGPHNVALAGELADGWLPAFFSPEHAEDFLTDLEKGLSRSGRRLIDIDITPNAMVAIGDDLQVCYDWVRPAYGLYLGGMGSRKDNFYARLATRYGFGEACEEIQELYLSGKRVEAYQAVPEELIDATALVGTLDRVVERMKRYEAAGVTTLIINPMAGTTEDRIEILTALAEARGTS